MTEDDIKALTDEEVLLLAVRASAEAVARGFTPEQVTALVETGHGLAVAKLMEQSMRAHGFIR